MTLHYTPARAGAALPAAAHPAHALSPPLMPSPLPPIHRPLLQACVRLPSSSVWGVLGDCRALSSLDLKHCPRGTRMQMQQALQRQALQLQQAVQQQAVQMQQQAVPMQLQLSRRAAAGGAGSGATSPAALGGGIARGMGGTSFSRGAGPSSSSAVAAVVPAAASGSVEALADDEAAGWLLYQGVCLPATLLL